MIILIFLQHSYDDITIRIELFIILHVKKNAQGV